MKKIISTLICLSWILFTISAQTPQAFKYQSVLRNNSGQALASKNVNIRISILSGDAAGPVIYSEKHTVQTNSFGLVNLEIGNGAKLSGTFSTINWGSEKYFVKVDLDANNTGLYTEMGASQLLSVPYALHAAKVGNNFAGSWNELADKPILFSGNYNDLTGKPNFAKIATTGSFNDLIDKPILVSVSKNPTLGDLLFHNGTGWELLPKGVNGQTLRLDQGFPKWGEPGYALPMVTTNPMTDVLQNGATSGGNVIATGYSEITARGVCWSINQNPTVADSKTTEPAGIGTYTSKLTGLLANTTYYARAYATNAAGTAYGNQVSFRTVQTVVFPTVSTSAAINVTENSAASGGNVTATGGAEVTAKGICWSTNQTPTVADNKSNEGPETGQFASQMANLSPGTLYYVRAYATNSAGTGYGSQVSFTTIKTLPIITTKNITDLSSMGGVTGGNITSNGGGTISERGICWGESPNPTILDNKEVSPSTQNSFSLAIIKATKPNTTYYVKAYAKNELGVAYGQEKSFTTTEAQYYTSFETGMTPVGWSGPWTVVSEESFDGSYSFKSLVSQTSETSRSFTLSQDGMLVFYFKLFDGYGGVTLELYLDNNLKESYNGDGTGWKQGLLNIPTGTHSIKFKLLQISVFGGDYCLIDHLTITK